MAKFVGKVGKVMVQLHDKLGLEVEGLRVMEAADDKLQVILGSDLFG